MASLKMPNGESINITLEKMSDEYGDRVLVKLSKFNIFASISVTPYGEVKGTAHSNVANLFSDIQFNVTGWEEIDGLSSNKPVSAIVDSIDKEQPC